ncbi:hypothetical protein BC628DRAFT_287958 [Trametes gibbosa]|nr:hypothetical protein BC628DRAFT_287958 [Trametes gibbosa]
MLRVTVTVRVKPVPRIRSRLRQPRPSLARHSSCTTMGRQQTLGKFFGKTGEPPVQTKLEEAFGGKRKRTVKAGAKEHDKPVAAESSPNEAPRSPSPTKDAEKPPQLKKRRVIESDSEDSPEPSGNQRNRRQRIVPNQRQSRNQRTS